MLKKAEKIRKNISINSDAIKNLEKMSNKTGYNHSELIEIALIQLDETFLNEKLIKLVLSKIIKKGFDSNVRSNKQQ